MPPPQRASPLPWDAAASSETSTSSQNAPHKFPSQRPLISAVISPRHLSTSADQVSSGCGAGKIDPFDRLYLQNLKPLIEETRIEKVRADVEAEEEEEARADVAEIEKEVRIEEEGDESRADVEEAWGYLRKAVVNYCGSPVGTLAADDPATENSPLNYDQVFIRDFVPSALAFLLKGESEIVKNFLLHTLQ